MSWEITIPPFSTPFTIPPFSTEQTKNRNKDGGVMKVGLGIPPHRHWLGRWYGGVLPPVAPPLPRAPPLGVSAVLAETR